MKTYFLFLSLLCSMGLGFSQNQASDFTGTKSDQVRNPRNDQMNFVPNEVLVKFKDAVPVAAGARVKVAGVSSVDQVLKAHGITSLEKLFPTAQKPLRARMMKSPQGKDMTIPALDKIYRISVPPTQAIDSMPTNIFQLIEELKALPEVEYAEPNYIYSIDDMQPVGPVLTAEDVANMQTPKQNSVATAFIPNDPLYEQQWYIPAVKADLVWEQTMGDTTQVIAILDTGVDWNHPDLKNKIWTNPNPDNTLNDIRGWDFINNDNNPMDDNSHGTHVAGIAAAETNNGIGIAGVCPKAKIMPIKVFQSSGRGDVATISKGIIYASTHGATVINMSFGSYARSLAMEDALANAYATTLLVAAAGNDGIDIERRFPPGRFYPAAISYVLGVMAPEASFSNKDMNGPTFSTYDELNNYEVKAPGTNILSTVPNGNYRVYQGTSMAAPVVSGLASLYHSIRPTESQEMLFGNLINSIETYVDIQKALNIIPTPQLAVVSYELVDTLDGDKDGKADAGETIQLKVNVRNTWGQADSVFVGVKFKEFEDTTTATIEKETAFIGAIDSYAALTNSKNLLQIKIQPNVAHNRDIQFVLQTWKGIEKEYLSEQEITIRVEHGTELKGVLEDTLRLTPDKFWLVSNSFKVASTGVLILEAGTHLKIEKTITLQGKIISKGEKEKNVIIEGPSGFTSSGKVDYKYTNFLNFVVDGGNAVIGGGLGALYNCHFDNIYGSISNGSPSFFDCTFYNINFWYNASGTYNNSNFYNLSSYNYPTTLCCVDQIRNCNFAKISIGVSTLSSLLYTPQIDYYNGDYRDSCNVLGNFKYLKSGLQASISSYNTYWGTLDSIKISDKVVDFWDVSNLAILKFKPFLDKPSSKAHACVWKVVVNGKDAQDEFKYLDPLGVAMHKFEVYFNRPMDIKYIPSVSMGVREPFNQVTINENGSWSGDSLVYTVYKTLGLTANNGLNRIQVINGKDIEGFDLVPESERFNVNIQTTSSASLEFMATAGLGKVNLEWNNNDLEDGLGYNMYRMEHINDSTLTKPVLINKTLIADTLYTDFAVTPNKKYYYYYKIVRTDLSETDSSKVVSATPFTASKGDANGDLSVNVLDITSIVAYLLNNNPQPFIFEAADLNSDGNINVLDIVGVVNKILNVPQNAPRIAMNQQVDLYMQNDTLFADATGDIGGIQLGLSGVSSTEDIQVLKALQGFESGYGITATGLRLLYYSMSSKSIAGGNRIPLLKMRKGSTITDAIFSETNGSPIKVNYILTRIGNISNNMNQTVAELGQNYPNPVNGQTIIPIRIYEPVDEAVLRVVNMMGQEVEIIRLSNPYIGEHLLPWDAGMNKGLFIYTLEVKIANQRSVCPNKKMIVQ